jgi:sec-independent protein translocase protein TatB
MLPGIGGSELIIIAIVALIVVGPKDLPRLLRQLGKFVAKMRGMADDFKASFDDMARQSELDDLRKEVEALRSGTSQSPIIHDIREDMRKIESDIHTQINPVGPSYARGDFISSPDEVDLNMASTEDINPEAVIKKPRKIKQKSDISNSIEPMVPTPESGSNPKRRRSPKKGVV